MDLAGEKRPGRQHHARRVKAQPHLGDNAEHTLALKDQVVDRLLEQGEVDGVLEHAAHVGLVQGAVGLATGRPHCRALARVQGAPLDAGMVGGVCHQPAERVDLAHQMALADATDGRVAAHLSERLDVVCQQQGTRAHTCRSKTGFGAGVAAADHNHVKCFRIIHGLPEAAHLRHFVSIPVADCRAAAHAPGHASDSGRSATNSAEIVRTGSQFTLQAIVKQRTFRAPLAQLVQRTLRTGSGTRKMCAGLAGRGRSSRQPGKQTLQGVREPDQIGLVRSFVHPEEGWRPAVGEEQGVFVRPFSPGASDWSRAQGCATA